MGFSEYDINYLIAYFKYERVADLAAHLNVSPGQVNLELKRLREQGVIEKCSFQDKITNRVKNHMSPVPVPVKSKPVKPAKSKPRKSKPIKSPPIKPDVVDISEHTYLEWRKISRNIKIRDNFTCRECGIKEPDAVALYGKYLHVHHIIPYSVSKNDEPSNLITLCIGCHRKKHPNIHF